MAISLVLEGKKVDLSDQDYLSGGGEAKVYRKGDTVYKVYDVAPGPKFELKVQELSGLGKKSNIIAPRKILYTKRNQVAGYTMDFVPSALPLPRLFTTGFQVKNGLSGSTLNALIAKMIETIHYIHDQGILMVDGNEFNYLVSGDFRNVFFIDVDSYQTPNFPATVLMPSIRDWQNPTFTRESDWFSFAVISTQLYLGIHPFRGTWTANPTLRDLKDRVLQRVSVFHPEVTVPAATRDPRSIPPNFRDWLVDTFQRGSRSEPPFPVEGVFVTFPKAAVPGIAVSSTHIGLAEVGAYDELVLVVMEGNRTLAVTRDTVFGEKSEWSRGSTVDQYFDAEGQFWSVAGGHPVQVRSLARVSVKADTSALGQGEPVVFGNRLYLIQNGTLVETRLYRLGSEVKLLERQRWPLSPQAYQVLDGLVEVDHLGARFLAIPFGSGLCGQFRVEALDGHKVIDGRFHLRVAMLTTSKNDRYYRTELHFDPEMETVILQNQYPVDQVAALNFVVIRGSTLVVLNEGGTLELSVVGQSAKKTVEGGPELRRGELVTDGSSLYLAQKERLFRLSMNT